MSKILDEKLKKMDERKQQLWALRHTAEHVLHTALQNIYPSMKKAMGPATDEGYYHDFDSDLKVADLDFPKVEKEMKRIIDLNLPMVQEFIDEDTARKIFKNNPYKLEWVDQIKSRGEKYSIYKMGDIDTDLCSGPHVKSTGEIKAFKLLKVAGAYWHGDEKNKMLTRIYGTCFPTKTELDNYLHSLAEAEKRDHRKLGQQLDLFSTNSLTGSGLILWHPKLARVRNIVEQFWKDTHYQHGYQLVNTPHIASMDMFVISRHLSKYINYMFPIMLHEYIEGESSPDYQVDEVLKPMNCPNHIQIYKSKPRSYKELPIRMGELGTVYRYERAGVLHGMTRVRGFTQDDTHIFCTSKQVIEEVKGIIRLTKYFYEVFGFKDYQAYIATRPEKYLGSQEVWNFAENALKKACEEEKIDYKIDEGEGVFYGPKIDSKVKDSLGREWQLGTIQFDFNQPSKADTTEEEIAEFWALKTFKQKFKTKDNLAKYLKKLGRGFDVKYINESGKEEHVVMIHRTILGSMERFFGVLIEHYGGAFPLWLAPVQLKIIPIADRHVDTANTIKTALSMGGIRVEIDDRNESMQSKIRDATLQKVPFMGIIGDKEIENSKGSSQKISVRGREGENLGQLTIEQLLSKFKTDIEKKL